MSIPRIIETRRFYNENQFAVILDSSEIYLDELTDRDEKPGARSYGLFALGGRDLIATITITPTTSRQSKS